MDAVDKTTPKPKGSGTLEAGDEDAGGEGVEESEDTPPALTKPALSSERVKVGTAVAFPKVPEHTYELKEEKTGVTLNKAAINAILVTATQSAQNVIIVATFDGRTIESNPIEFVEITKPALSSERVKVGTAVTFPKVPGYAYRLKEEKTGVTLSEDTGNRMQITATRAASGVVVVATLDGLTEESNPIEFVEIIKPVFSKELAPWDEAITFTKIAEHTYELKEEKTGVTLSEVASDTMQVTATQSAQNVIIVVTLDGDSIESNPIEFTRIPGNYLYFEQISRTVNPNINRSIIVSVTNNNAVAEDNRNIQYSVSPTGQGVTIDSSSGVVAITSSATERDYTITAELEQNAKYDKTTAVFTLTLSRE